MIFVRELASAMGVEQRKFGRWITERWIPRIPQSSPGVAIRLDGPGALALGIANSLQGVTHSDMVGRVLAKIAPKNRSTTFPFDIADLWELPYGQLMILDGKFITARGMDGEKSGTCFSMTTDVEIAETVVMASINVYLPPLKQLILKLSPLLAPVTGNKR